jgi:hypothetical protein
MTGPENPPVADPTDDRPWQLGVMRRDCEPDRGCLLTFLSGVALACGVLSFLVALPALLGLPLGILTARMADRDLTRICHGSLDPGGHRLTCAALCRVERAVHWNAVGPFACPLVWLCLSLLYFDLQ